MAEDWHIEEDLENAKDMGLDHYEVRSYLGWYRHITLVLLALAYLTGICATQRGAPDPATTARSASTAAVLALTVDSRAPSAGAAHLACFFVRTSGAGMPRGGGALTKAVPALSIPNVVSRLADLTCSACSCGGVATVSVPRLRGNFRQVWEVWEVREGPEPSLDLRAIERGGPFVHLQKEV